MLPQVLLLQREQFQDLQPRKQGAVDLVGRVLGGGPQQDDVAALDVGQEGVLDAAVEMVDLVDEQRQRLAALPGAAPCDRSISFLISAMPETVAENSADG